MAQAVAAGQRAVRQLLLAVLPGEGHAVQLLLPLRSDGAAASTTVGRVFPRDVALPVTAHHRAPNTQDTRKKSEAVSWDCGTLMMHSNEKLYTSFPFQGVHRGLDNY